MVQSTKTTDRHRSTGPHRILALDGGGIRGIVSVEVLARIETLLREDTGDSDLLLGDWFDLIAGTSTGAITAALLATGHSVRDVQRFYEGEPAELFDPSEWHERLYRKYDSGYFARRLQEIFGAETTLGSGSIRCLLLLVLRNVTTDSPWFLTNNPAAKFNDPSLPACNLQIPLWQLVRASTAAPTYFDPEVIEVGEETFVFGDGGLTGYSNPAFKAFLMATVEPYRLSWPTGPERMLLVSIGTGARCQADEDLRPRDMHLWYHAQTLPFALMSAARDRQDLLCRVFGDCLAGPPIDEEVGDLIGAAGPVDPKLFTYLRYDVPLTPEGLRGIGCGHIDPGRITTLSDTDTLDDLRAVGQALGARRVQRAHFGRFLAASHGSRAP
jgi:hypothetical protein